MPGGVRVGRDPASGGRAGARVSRGRHPPRRQAVEPVPHAAADRLSAPIRSTDGQGDGLRPGPPPASGRPGRAPPHSGRSGGGHAAVHGPRTTHWWRDRLPGGYLRLGRDGVRDDRRPRTVPWRHCIPAAATENGGRAATSAGIVGGHDGPVDRDDGDGYWAAVSELRGIANSDRPGCKGGSNPDRSAATRVFERSARERSRSKTLVAAEQRSLSLFGSFSL